MVAKIIKAAVAALIPLLYSIIIKAFPDFPISQNELIEALLWLIGMFFAGGYANSAKIDLVNSKQYKP